MLEYKVVQCLICDDFSEDMQKFQSVRLNVIHGKLDPEKFLNLYEEMAKKYGKETVAGLMKITDEKALKGLIKDVRAGLSPEMQKKLDEAKKEIKSVDDIGSILNEMFSKSGHTLEVGFMVFSFGGKEHHYVELDKQLLKRVKYLEELAVSKKEPLVGIFNRVLGGEWGTLRADAGPALEGATPKRGRRRPGRRLRCFIVVLRTELWSGTGLRCVSGARES